MSQPAHATRSRPWVGPVRTSIWKRSRLTKQRIVCLVWLSTSLVRKSLGLAGLVSGPIFASSKSWALVVKASPSTGQARLARFLATQELLPQAIVNSGRRSDAACRIMYWGAVLTSVVRRFHRVDAAQAFNFAVCKLALLAPATNARISIMQGSCDCTAGYTDIDVQARGSAGVYGSCTPFAGCATRPDGRTQIVNHQPSAYL